MMHAICDSSSSQSVCHATQIKEAALELGYQADETFCLKISQLREIFVVRWSVFLLGPAGCGKSAIWKTLMRAQQNFGEKTFFKPINPKVSVTFAVCTLTNVQVYSQDLDWDSVA